MSDLITTDAVIIGGGPVGLFAIFELGLLDIRCEVIDILDRAGGQCTELYPEKPIYDIPGYPVIFGQELTDRLLEQAAPFNPGYHFNQMVTELEKLDDGTFRVATDEGTEFRAPVVVIAAGGGVKAGFEYGRTDDFAYNIVENPVHIRDLNATILHCLGIDHHRFSYPFQGLEQRITGVEEAHVVEGILM